MHLLQENTLRGSKTWRSKKCNLAHQTQTRLIAAPKHTCIAQQLQMQKEKFWEILAAHKVSRRQSCTEKEFRNAAKVGSKDLQCDGKVKIRNFMQKNVRRCKMCWNFMEEASERENREKIF